LVVGFFGAEKGEKKFNAEMNFAKPLRSSFSAPRRVTSYQVFVLEYP
jgi:hypothetical protein